VANLYLSDDLASPVVGETATVGGTEARHAVTVNRLAVGERVRVGNGLGTIVAGIVSSVSAAEFRFEVDAVETLDRPSPALWLAQALAKGDRDELAVQAATELGADGVIPWSAARSIARWDGAKVAKGQDRWGAIVREATKQSARGWIPEVAPLVTTKQLAALAATTTMLVLDPLGEPFGTSQFATTLTRTDTAEKDLPGGTRDLVVVVGPEGGISPGELELLYASGAIGVKLGAGILRTSTAGPAAIAVLSAKLGRW
jgi:16S rRNA (uracil1498-N3)-methyltransferase